MGEHGGREQAGMKVLGGQGFGSLPRFLLGEEGELEAGVGGVWEVTGKEQGRFNF